MVGAQGQDATFGLQACLKTILSPSAADDGEGMLSPRGQPLPRVELVPVGSSQNDDEDDEGGRKFQTMLTFLLGNGGGPEGDGMPRDVFRVALDLTMPAWDPLRKLGAPRCNSRAKEGLGWARE